MMLKSATSFQTTQTISKVGVPLIDKCTTTTYDNIAVTGTEFNPMYTGSSFYRIGVQVITGSSAINTYIRKVKFSIKKVLAPTGNGLFTVRDSSDNLITSTTIDVSTFTTSFADYEGTFSVPVKLLVGYRVMFEYDAGGDASNYVAVEGKVETTQTGFEKTSYDGSSYTDNTLLQVAETFDSDPTC